jgi:hypothetical protein
MHRAIDEAIPSGLFDTVIFSARWKKKHVKHLKKVIAWTRKHVKDIVILGPTIEYSNPLPTLLAKSSLRNDDGALVDAARQYNNAKKRARYLFSNIKNMKIKYFSVIDSVCPEKKCFTTDNSGIPLQFDYGHFTYKGALFVIKRLKKRGLLLTQ